MTRMTVIGIEGMEGVGRESGKAYAMGRLHTSIPLAPPMKDQIAKGEVGTTYDCDLNLIKKVAHLPTPFVCEADMQDQQKFGKRVQIVVDLRPVERAAKAS
jgi:hypothetical protein